MRFLAPRVSDAVQLRALETPPRGSFVAAFFRAYVPDPRRLLSRPDRDRQSPGDAHGIYLLPFAVLLPPAGDGVFRRLAPTCRFATCRRAFHRRGIAPLVAMRPKVCGCGSWGLAPRANRAV